MGINKKLAIARPYVAIPITLLSSKVTTISAKSIDRETGDRIETVKGLHATIANASL